MNKRFNIRADFEEAKEAQAAALALLPDLLTTVPVEVISYSDLAQVPATAAKSIHVEFDIDVRTTNGKFQLFYANDINNVIVKELPSGNSRVSFTALGDIRTICFLQRLASSAVYVSNVVVRSVKQDQTCFDKIKQRTKLSTKGKSSYGPQR